MLYFSLRLQELDDFKSIKISTPLHILTCQYKGFRFAQDWLWSAREAQHQPWARTEQGERSLPSPVLRQKPNALISLLSQKKGDYFAVER